jgi:hypothetical protein
MPPAQQLESPYLMYGVSIVPLAAATFINCYRELHIDLSIKPANSFAGPGIYDRRVPCSTSYMESSPERNSAILDSLANPAAQVAGSPLHCDKLQVIRSLLQIQDTGGILYET